MNQQQAIIKVIDDIISDPEFIKFVRQNVGDIMKARRNRQPAKEGYRYKRDWYDRLLDKGNTKPEFFMANIKSVWLKESKLSSELRDIVAFVGDKSLNQTTELHAIRNAKAN